MMVAHYWILYFSYLHRLELLKNSIPSSVVEVSRHLYIIYNFLVLNLFGKERERQFKEENHYFSFGFLYISQSHSPSAKLSASHNLNSNDQYQLLIYAYRK